MENTKAILPYVSIIVVYPLHLFAKAGFTALCYVRNNEMRNVLIGSGAKVNVEDKVRRWDDVSVARVWG